MCGHRVPTPQRRGRRVSCGSSVTVDRARGPVVGTGQDRVRPPPLTPRPRGRRSNSETGHTPGVPDTTRASFLVPTLGGPKVPVDLSLSTKASRAGPSRGHCEGCRLEDSLRLRPRPPLKGSGAPVYGSVPTRTSLLGPGTRLGSRGCRPGHSESVQVSRRVDGTRPPWPPVRSSVPVAGRADESPQTNVPEARTGGGRRTRARSNRGRSRRGIDPRRWSSRGHLRGPGRCLLCFHRGPGRGRGALPCPVRRRSAPLPGL